MVIRRNVVFLEYALLAGAVASTAALGVFLFEGRLRGLFKAVIDSILEF